MLYKNEKVEVRTGLEVKSRVKEVDEVERGYEI